MTIVIVGFKVKEANSVFYKKLTGIVLNDVNDDAKLLGSFKAALKVSDFVSVRVIPGEIEEEQPTREGVRKYILEQ